MFNWRDYEKDSTLYFANLFKAIIRIDDNNNFCSTFYNTASGSEFQVCEYKNFETLVEAKSWAERKIMESCFDIVKAAKIFNGDMNV